VPTFNINAIPKVFLIVPALCIVLLLGFGWGRFHSSDTTFQEEAPGSTPSTGVLKIRLSPDGHYHIVGLVNGRKLTFLVDTGATNVILDTASARKVGFDVPRLQYDQIINTANGSTRAASVVLDELAIGSLRIRQHPATINEGDLDVPLLGMDFLRRVGTIEIKNDVMTLRW